MKLKFNIFFVFLIYSLNVLSQHDNLKDFKTVYSQGFGKEECLEDFNFSDKSQWLISRNGKSGKSLKCLGAGAYSNNFGGPSVIALLHEFEMEDVIIEMDVMHNGQDYNLRDLCIYFGVKDTAHYSYAQIANRADKNTHNIFVVEGDKPKRAGIKHNEGIIWGMKQWQQVRVEYLTSRQTVKVYFNDELIMESTDQSLTGGHIGFGSSDSSIKVDNFKVTAPSYKTNSIKLFD